MININIQHVIYYLYPNSIQEFNSREKTICIYSIHSYPIHFHRYI
jgi:hypothetical protein